MRVGPDGLPRPWSAESVTYVDPTTVEAKLRPGQTWHDGKPVTVEDVIFSFEAPAGDKSPMYKPFVANIASMEKVDDKTIRFKLKAPNASFFTSTLAKINLIPKHVWEPILSGNQLQGKNAEAYQEPQPVGSGPFKVVRFKLQEEILLEKNPSHWAAPKMDRWILRIVTNTEAAVGMLRRGEVNFLSDYRGDPKILDDIAKQQKEHRDRRDGRHGLPLRRRRTCAAPPFDDVNFRKALILAINRNLMAQAAWNGYAVPANSHVSAGAAVLAQGRAAPRPNLEEAKKMLEEGRLQAGRRQAALSRRQEGRAAGAELRRDRRGDIGSQLAMREAAIQRAVRDLGCAVAFASACATSECSHAHAADPLRPDAVRAVGGGDDPVLPVPADAGRPDRRLYRHHLHRGAGAQLKQTFGLDRPLHEQYVIYLRNLSVGEFGDSFHHRRPVIEVLGERAAEHDRADADRADRRLHLRRAGRRLARLEARHAGSRASPSRPC